MVDKFVDGDRYELLLKLYARAIHSLELQLPFLDALSDLLPKCPPPDGINSESVDAMRKVILSRVGTAKQILHVEGLNYPPQ